MIHGATGWDGACPAPSCTCTAFDPQAVVARQFLHLIDYGKASALCMMHAPMHRVTTNRAGLQIRFLRRKREVRRHS
jgi:hypothetical protein